MSEWVGFSDADLQRMKEAADDPRSKSPRIVKPVTGGRGKPGMVGSKQQRKQNPKSVRPQKAQGDVPAGAMLSKPPPKKIEPQKKVVSPPTTPNEQIPLHGKTCTPTEENDETPIIEKPESATIKEPEILEDKELIQEKEKLKLEDIQRRQKEMEEKNKRKKTMLTKAIAERKKKAYAESNKLVKIQAELAKLDDMLNYDVSILRDRIDEACHEYNTAQKRFEKAEAEYIESKIKLHRATEMKEELTEHLYKLIQLNEERKANKLEELMQKLELEETEEEESSNTNQQPLETSESSKPEEESPEQNGGQNETDHEKAPENIVPPSSTDGEAKEEAGS